MFLSYGAVVYNISFLACVLFCVGQEGGIVVLRLFFIWGHLDDCVGRVVYNYSCKRL
jgi:hypothetical protein